MNDWEKTLNLGICERNPTLLVKHGVIQFTRTSFRGDTCIIHLAAGLPSQQSAGERTDNGRWLSCHSKLRQSSALGVADGSSVFKSKVR